ncbi:MAG: hypothetical protein LBE20_06890 [Deltaproteobacteria bacterium]|jgi:hypothetical protein|nr:hypothetical protein [Deltaproteobacteria bacterium]
MVFSKFKTRRRILHLLLLGIFILLIGLGNFYVGQIKIHDHQQNIEEIKQTILNTTSAVSVNPDLVYSKLEFSLQKSITRMNYYKLVKVGGLIFILLGLGLIFIAQLLRLK